MPRYVMEFESAAEMAAVAAVLEGGAEVKAMPIELVNDQAQTILVTGKASEDGAKLVVSIGNRTHPNEVPAGSQLLPPGARIPLR